MIFHTAAESVYYEIFFETWHQTIKQHWPEAKFSLRFVGENHDAAEAYCHANDIIFSHDSITFEQIKEKHAVDDAQAKGYYAMARWASVPFNEDNVCVTDVDVIALKISAQEKQDLETRLLSTPMIFISRQKGPKINPMMGVFLHKSVCGDVKRRAKDILKNSVLAWNSDVGLIQGLRKDFIFQDDFKIDVIDNSYDLNKIEGRLWFGYYSSSSVIHEGKSYEYVESKRMKYQMMRRAMSRVANKQ